MAEEEKKGRAVADETEAQGGTGNDADVSDIAGDLHDDLGGLENATLRKLVEYRLSTSEPREAEAETGTNNNGPSQQSTAMQDPTKPTAKKQKDAGGDKAVAMAAGVLLPNSSADALGDAAMILQLKEEQLLHVHVEPNQRDPANDRNRNREGPQDEQLGPGAYAEAPPAGLRNNNPPTVQQQTSIASESDLESDTDVNVNEEMDTSGLAVAAPVEDPSSNQDAYPDLPRAQEHNQEAQGRKSLPQSFIATAFMLGIVFFLGVFLLLVFLLADGSQDDIQSATTNRLTEEPTLSPTRALTLEEVIRQKLPNYTITALNDPELPQSQALEWLLNDPEATNYSETRLIQRFALATLFLGTNGPRWVNNDGWLNYTMHECEWDSGDSYALEGFNSEWLSFIIEDRTSYSSESVPCDSHGHYNHLWLNANLLKGEVPPELFLLTNLKSIALGLNELWGTISSNIGQLTKLEALGFVGVDLTGTLPTEIGLLSNLIELEPLANLTGTLPTELGLLTKLEILSLEANLITGPLPTEIGMMKGLLSFTMDETLLSGSLPSEAGELSSLQLLDIFHTKLTGSLPSELGKLQALERVNFAENFFLNGTLPSELGLLTNIRNHFSLFDNSFTGTIPTELAQMTKITGFWSVAWNDLSGPIPSELGLLTNLEYGLFVDTNRLTGTIPTEMGLLSKSALAFQCHVNFLTGTIPTELGLLTSLINFAGAIYGLSIGDNQLTGTIPTELGMLGQVQNFAVDDCQLTGPIPSELGMLEDVKSLRLNGNFLEGTIPSQIWNLTTVQWLRLGNNSLLGGTLPSDVGLLTNLDWLSLEHSQINGSLPFLGSLSSLSLLDLEHTLLSGTFPEELEGLSSNHSLEAIWMRGSQLVGSIAESLCPITTFDCELGYLCGCNCSCVDNPQ